MNCSTTNVAEQYAEIHKRSDKPIEPPATLQLWVSHPLMRER